MRCAAANLLVGNDEGAAGLECVFFGPELEFTADATVAVTGATMRPKVNGAPRENWASFKVKAGDLLSFDFLQRGARAYIAVSGGIDVPVVLGSRSTYALGALGGHQGRSLKAGDELPVGAGSGKPEGRIVPQNLRRMPGTPAELRVLPGLYWHRITEEAGRNFFADDWKVAPEADRIGYRFRGGRPLQFVPREAAVRRGVRSLQHRRRLLPLWLDPGAGRHRADRVASRRGFGRRLLHARHGDLGRYGSDRTAAAPYRDAFRPVDMSQSARRAA